MKNVKLTNVCPVLISEDIVNTVNFYVEKLGFKYAKHYDKIDNFATLYRDSIELIVVQSKFGKVQSNAKRYGAGYDAYIDPDTIEGVDELYQEFLSKGVKIIEEPRKTDYGSYEFVLEDIDGRPKFSITMSQFVICLQFLNLRNLAETLGLLSYCQTIETI